MFNIPQRCEIRWQAALAVLEDLQADTRARFNQAKWADDETLWERKNGCGSAACFAGYISVSPYCKALGYPKDDNGCRADNWLMDGESSWNHEKYVGLDHELFRGDIGEDMSRRQTLAELKRRIKAIFKESTGKALVAPTIFWID